MKSFIFCPARLVPLATVRKSAVPLTAPSMYVGRMPLVVVMVLLVTRSRSPVVPLKLAALGTLMTSVP